MSALLRFLQRACAYCVLRSLERQYHDQTNMLGRIMHVDTYIAAQRSWSSTARELAEARGTTDRLRSATPRREMLA
ncbi:hypothetical protein [Propionivibrio sp.]|uniref:hypothetical protein n=1 Tax=Propionivibrio sp. TaxID=2212460 RepID=UPI0025F3474B|nr:hypothetical protein [Propionivibrio sp.]MBK7357449.1 hypothetical protein [Propionivibrio sp.]